MQTVEDPSQIAHVLRSGPSCRQLRDEAPEEPGKPMNLMMCLNERPGGILILQHSCNDGIGRPLFLTFVRQQLLLEHLAGALEPGASLARR
jgi:hypothetical protein